MRPTTALAYIIRKLLRFTLLFAAFIFAVGFLMIPWAVPLPGRATLSGEWTGRLRSSRGPEAQLFLSLAPKHSLKPLWTYVVRSAQFNSPPGALIEGRALLCTRRLGRIEFVVNGYTTAWSGETLELLIEPRRRNRPELRLTVQGEWRDRSLDLVQNGHNLDDTLGEPGRGGNNDRDWIKADLTKGSESDWLAACRRLN